MTATNAAPPPTRLDGPVQLVGFRDPGKPMTMIDWKLLFAGGGNASKTTPMTVHDDLLYAVGLDHNGAPYKMYALDPGRIRQNSPIPGVRNDTLYRYLDDLHERDGISVSGESVRVVTGPLALPNPGEPWRPTCNSSLVPLDERFRPVILATRAAVSTVRRVDIVFDGNEEEKGVSLVEESRLLLPDDCARKTILSVSVPLEQDLALRIESYVRIRAGARLYHFSRDYPVSTTTRDVVSVVVGVRDGLLFVAITEADETISGRTEPEWVQCAVEEADIVSIVRY